MIFDDSAARSIHLTGQNYCLETEKREMRNVVGREKGNENGPCEGLF